MLLNSIQLTIRCVGRPRVLSVKSLKTITPERNATGWTHRRPIAVVNEEIKLDKAEEASLPSPRKSVRHNFEYRPMQAKVPHRPSKPAQPVARSDLVYNKDGTPNLHPFAEDERALSSLIIALKSKKTREKRGKILLEGIRLIEDAIKAGIKPETILFSRFSDLVKLELPTKGVKLYKVPYSTLQLWSSLTTTPGVMGVFAFPESFEKETTRHTLPMTIICDNVREPGNLGTIIRAAAGVGCERLILTKGCVDLWEQKVLRSAAGAHFRVSISKSVEWEDIQEMISPTANLYVADSNATVCADEESIASKRSDIRVSASNEDVQNSEKEAEYVFAGDAEAESPEMTLKEHTEENVSENDAPEADSSDKLARKESKNFARVRKVTIDELASRIPVIPYYAVDYASNETVLIVGGETEGLSHETIELVRKRGGVRVNIPMTNEVESLNTGMALGIIAFEIKRQFSVRKLPSTE